MNLFSVSLEKGILDEGEYLPLRLRGIFVIFYWYCKLITIIYNPKLFVQKHVFSCVNSNSDFFIV